MATEIKILSVSKDGVTVSALFYYPIPSGLRIDDPLTSSPFLVTPTADMEPDWLPLLSAAEQTEVNAGRALVHNQTLKVDPSESAGQRLSSLQASYAGVSGLLLTAYQNRYTHKNTQHNAV